MPKINVYVPDDLAEAVRQAGLPVSAVCQRALEMAVRNAASLRESAEPNVDLPPGIQLPARGTPRFAGAIRLAFEAARTRGASAVGTEHLLLGILDERANLGVRLLAALDVEPDDVRAEIEGLMRQKGDATAGESSQVSGLTPEARRVLELTGEEAIRMVHNYIGCEHLLIALTVERDGLAGRALRTLGIEPVATRRAVASAIQGVVHARVNLPGPAARAALQQTLTQIATRLDRIEARLGSD